MSGPKSISPPPRYSMQVFEGKLNQVFQLQSRLSMLRSEIESFQLNDTKLNIHIDCNHELSKIRKQIERELMAVVFDYQGTFDQGTYYRINAEIEKRISGLMKIMEECEMIKAGFVKKKTDYDSYQSYLRFYENSFMSFNDFKNQIINYLKSNIEATLPELFKEANYKISVIEFNQHKTDFRFGFTSKFESEKRLVVDHVAESENLINAIRADISDKVIDKFQATSGKQKKATQSEKLSEETRIISEKIKSLIRNCEIAAIRKKYKADFDNLVDSDSLKDIYFFKELHDSIYEAEKTRKIKDGINAILSELNISPFHEAVQAERQNLVKLCLASLNNYSITKNEFAELESKLGQLKTQSKKYFEEDEIKNREHLFLKSQLILSMENLGYEVMDDLEVIDFENENDFLLKIKGQENYLNLKFKEDGSVRYVFQIPENKDDLSTDQKNLKLHEMKVTCSEFHTVLQDLAKMGLNVSKKSELPIDFDTLVSVTKIQREKLGATKNIQRQGQQLRKKYLN